MLTSLDIKTNLVLRRNLQYINQGFLYHYYSIMVCQHEATNLIYSYEKENRW